MTATAKREELAELKESLERLRTSFRAYVEISGAKLPAGFGELVQRMVLEGPAAVRQVLGQDAFDRAVRVLAAMTACYGLTTKIDELALEIDALEDPVEPRRDATRVDPARQGRLAASTELSAKNS